jgi:hypothetical protein
VGTLLSSPPQFRSCAPDCVCRILRGNQMCRARGSAPPRLNIRTDIAHVRVLPRLNATVGRAQSRGLPRSGMAKPMGTVGAGRWGGRMSSHMHAHLLSAVEYAWRGGARWSSVALFPHGENEDDGEPRSPRPLRTHLRTAARPSHRGKPKPAVLEDGSGRARSRARRQRWGRCARAGEDTPTRIRTISCTFSSSSSISR